MYLWSLFCAGNSIQKKNRKITWRWHPYSFLTSLQFSHAGEFPENWDGWQSTSENAQSRTSDTLAGCVATVIKTWKHRSRSRFETQRRSVGATWSARSSRERIPQRCYLKRTIPLVFVSFYIAHRIAGVSMRSCAVWWLFTRHYFAGPPTRQQNVVRWSNRNQTKLNVTRLPRHRAGLN